MKSQVKLWQFAALVSLSFGLEPCYLVFIFILDLCCLIPRWAIWDHHGPLVLQCFQNFFQTESGTDLWMLFHRNCQSKESKSWEGRFDWLIDCMCNAFLTVFQLYCNGQCIYPYFSGILFNPLPDMWILEFSNSAANKDMMPKIWTNGDAIIWAENIVGKGEIAHYEQFLLFQQCFLKLSVVDASKWVSME